MADKKWSESALATIAKLDASQAVLAWASAGVEASSAGLNPNFTRSDPLGQKSLEILWRWGADFPAQAERFAQEMGAHGGGSDWEMMSGFIYLASCAGARKKLPFDVEWIDGEALRVDIEEWRFPSERLALCAAWVFDDCLENCQSLSALGGQHEDGLAVVESALPAWKFYWARNGVPSDWSAVESMAMQSMEADALLASIPEPRDDPARKPRL